MSEEQPLDIKERDEIANVILTTALNRLREMGFAVVADGTVHGNGVWMDALRPVYRGKVLPPLEVTNQEKPE